MTALDHAGLVVADLDAACDFWAAAFRAVVEHPFDLGTDGIRGAMLTLPDGGRVELFERPGSTPVPAPTSPIAALGTRGWGHVALQAPDIGPLVEAAVAAGAGVHVAPSPSPEPGVRFAFLADLEGNLVELVERP